jgi:hypothetical protein
MRASPNLRRVIQLALFHPHLPHLRDPHWEQLPWEVRQHTVRLLARMLREYCERRLASSTKEAGDE